MQTITVYYSPEAALSGASLFYDGSAFFEPLYNAVRGLNGKKFKGFLKKVGKGVKKVAKTTFKVIEKAIPVANAVLTFIPGVGWAAKAALTAAELGIKAAKKHKAKKDAAKAAKTIDKLPVVNSEPIIEPETQVEKSPITNNTKNQSLPTQSQSVSYNDIIAIQQAYASKQPSPSNIIDIAKMMTPATELLSQLTEAKTKGGVTADEVRDMARTKVRGKLSIV